ncbi:hypothetical protein ACFTXJ_13250 [Streptomyces zhihengii]|uniref:hypothetical protein n=1 Tax=Streptomyces zhihengii TaxID=1818004 RepID=UPI0036439D68
MQSLAFYSQGHEETIHFPPSDRPSPMVGATAGTGRSGADVSRVADGELVVDARSFTADVAYEAPAQDRVCWPLSTAAS